MKKYLTVKNFTILFIAAIAIFATGLSCGGKQNNAETVTLNFWKPFDSTDTWSNIIRAFEDTHKGVKITYTQKSPETYESDLINAMAAGQGPDIYSVRNDWLPQYLDKTTPLSGTKFSIRDFRQTYLPFIEKDFMINGNLYGLPMTVDVLAMYYNRDLLASAGIARPPATWPEFVELVPSLTQTSFNGKINRSAASLGTSSNINRSEDILAALMLQSSVEFYDANMASVTVSRGTPDENNESPAARSLRFYTQFANPASRVYTWDAQQPDSIDAFAAGKTAFLFGYSYLAPTIETKQPFLEYEAAAFPQLSATGIKTNFASYWAQTVWNGSRNRDLAWEFILFASEYENNKAYAAAVNQVSSRLDVITEQQQDPRLGVFAENALSAKTLQKPDAAKFDKLMNEAIDQVSLAGVEPKDAISEFQSKLQLLLRSNPLR